MGAGPLLCPPPTHGPPHPSTAGTTNVRAQDWWWKARLAKCYYRLGLLRDAEKQFISALKNQAREGGVRRVARTAHGARRTAHGARRTAHGARRTAHGARRTAPSTHARDPAPSQRTPATQRLPSPAPT